MGSVLGTPSTNKNLTLVLPRKAGQSRVDQSLEKRFWGAVFSLKSEVDFPSLTWHNCMNHYLTEEPLLIHPNWKKKKMFRGPNTLSQMENVQWRTILFAMDKGCVRGRRLTLWGGWPEARTRVSHTVIFLQAWVSPVGWLYLSGGWELLFINTLRWE